jgi:hypothetical protein
MGVVYKARQVGLNRLVALKMILSGGHASPEDLMRFRIEAEAVALLQHPNIVQIHETGERDGRPFFSLEYVEGGTLQERIKGVPQPPRVAARLIEVLARAVHFAHLRGVVHRDLKPANVLLAGQRTSPLELCVPKITDFGLAKRLGADAHEYTGTEAVLGTPAYMAPEQAQGRTRHVGPAADVYALGAILYDLLTGEPPFKGSSVLDTLQLVQTSEPIPPRRHHRLRGARRAGAVPTDLDTICLKCLEKAPERRYVSAEALAEDLRRFLDGEPILARPVSVGERAWKWARRRPALAALIAFAAFGAALVVTLIAVKNADLEVQRRKLDLANRELGQANSDLDRRNQDLLDANVKLREADEARRKALANAESAFRDAEAERAETQEGFLRAEHAVEELVRVSQQRLRNVPQMEALRKVLLHDALALCGKFVSKGKSPGARLLTARVRRLMGDLHERLGDPAKARAEYEQAVALYNELLEGTGPFEVQHRAECLAELLAAHLRLWSVLEAQGLDGSASITSASLLLDKHRELVGAKKATPDVRRLEASLLNNQAVDHLRKGQLGRARRKFEAATALLREPTDRPDLLLERARVAVNRAGLFALQQDHESARAAYQEAVKELRPLVQQGPAYRQELGRAYAGLGRQLLALGDEPAARKAHEEALNLFRDLGEQFPHVADYAHLKALATADLGRHDLAVKRDADAARHLASARAELERMAERFPGVQDYQLDSVRAGLGLAQARMRLGQLDEAQTVLEADQAILAAPGRDAKSRAFRALRLPVYQSLLACHHLQALHFRDRGDARQANAHLVKLVELRTARLAELRSLPRRRPGDGALDHVSEVLEALYEQARERLDLAATCVVHANTLLAVGDDVGAARAVRGVFAVVPPDADAHRQALVVLAGCVGLAARDARRPPVEREARAVAYGKELLEQMRRGCGPGEDGLEELAASGELAPLRAIPALRASLRRLLEERGGKAVGIRR